MSNPVLAAPNALSGTRVGLSVSGSADLERLGLSEAHINLVVVEIARAIILAGGIVVYGGRLRPAGFTGTIMQEVHRFGDDRQALEIYVPEPEYRNIPTEDLRAIDTRLGTSGALRLVSATGELVPISCLQNRNEPLGADSEALTSMRQRVTEVADARIAVGGKLVGFKGQEPGVIEESRLTLEASKPLYIAGGYGGAAAAMVRTLEVDDLGWAPDDFPLGAAASQAALTRLAAAFEKSGTKDGLTPDERQLLAVSHRPANIATLLVLGLSRLRGSPNDDKRGRI